MKPILKQYKQLLSKVRRLPLPQAILYEVIQLTKHKYTTVIPTKYPINITTKYTTINRLLDDILIEENYNQLVKILDLIYKRKYPSWWFKFQLSSYTKLKNYWPNVHLIDEITIDSSIKIDYIQKLKQPQLLVQDWMKSVTTHEQTPTGRFELVRNYSKQENELDELIKQVNKLYLFLKKHRKQLDILNIPTFEVIYTVTRFGTPETTKRRDAKLKSTINNVKYLLKNSAPMQRSDLDNLTNIVYEQPSINPNFFKYIRTKKFQDKQIVSYSILKILRPKQLIIEDFHIYKLLREYIQKQYYYDETINEYHTSEFTNFYLNEQIE